jgi:hypothetical protein
MIQVKDIMKLTGLSYRQVQYWDDEIIQAPKRKEKEGEANFRCFSLQDALMYKALSELKTLGISLQGIRKRYLDQLLKIFNFPQFGPNSSIIKWGNKLALLYNGSGLYVPSSTRANRAFSTILFYDSCIERLGINT